MGATGAWAPKEIFQWVPGTRPEKKIGFKRPNRLKSLCILANKTENPSVLYTGKGNVLRDPSKQ